MAAGHLLVTSGLVREIIFSGGYPTDGCEANPSGEDPPEAAARGAAI